MFITYVCGSITLNLVLVCSPIDIRDRFIFVLSLMSSRTGPWSFLYTTGIILENYVWIGFVLRTIPLKEMVCIRVVTGVQLDSVFFFIITFKVHNLIGGAPWRYVSQGTYVISFIYFTLFLLINFTRYFWRFKFV